MKKLVLYVGLDVHKNSIEVAFADPGRNGEVRSYGKIDGNLTALDKVKNWKRKELSYTLPMEPDPAVIRFIVISVAMDTTVLSSLLQ